MTSCRATPTAIGACRRRIPKLIHSQDPARKTAGPILGTTYFYYCLELMTRYAHAARPAGGCRSVSPHWRSDSRTGSTPSISGAISVSYDNGTQTTSVLPLAFEMVPDDQRQPVFDHLVRKITDETHGHVGTGLVGGQWLNRVLTAGGRPDLAYGFANRHRLSRVGATWFRRTRPRSGSSGTGTRPTRRCRCDGTFRTRPKVCHGVKVAGQLWPRRDKPGGSPQGRWRERRRSEHGKQRPMEGTNTIARLRATRDCTGKTAGCFRISSRDWHSLTSRRAAAVSWPGRPVRRSHCS